MKNCEDFLYNLAILSILNKLFIFPSYFLFFCGNLHFWFKKFWSLTKRKDNLWMRGKNATDSLPAQSYHGIIIIWAFVRIWVEAKVITG